MCTCRLDRSPVRHCAVCVLRVRVRAREPAHASTLYFMMAGASESFKMGALMSALGCSAEETEATMSNPIFDEKWPAYEAKMKVGSSL